MAYVAISDSSGSQRCFEYDFTALHSDQMSRNIIERFQDGSTRWHKERRFNNATESRGNEFSSFHPLSVKEPFLRRCSILEDATFSFMTTTSSTSGPGIAKTVRRIILSVGQSSRFKVDIVSIRSTKTIA